MIVPLNNHIQVQPLKREGTILTHDKNYESKGIVLSDVKAGEVDLKGKTVYFDSWLAKKYNEGTDEEFWLIPGDSVAAYE